MSTSTLYKKVICIAASSIAALQLSAQATIPKDTSFTIYGTYIKEKKARPYIEIAQPVESKDIGSKKDVIYEEIGERKLLLDAFYSKKSKGKKPAILLVFGGGWRSGSKEQNWAMCSGLVRSGYIAVTPEYRLSLEAPYPAALYDLKTAVRWMKAHAKEYRIDTSKIAVLGCSAGGQLAALAGTTNGDAHFEDKTLGFANHSSDVQAIIDIDGTLAFHHPESAEGKASSDWFGGDYAHKPELWEEAAPLNHVSSTTPPVLFLNSSLPRFHAGRTDFIHKTDSLHIYTEIHEFPDTPHPFWFFHPWFTPMMEYMIQFLQKTF